MPLLARRIEKPSLWADAEDHFVGDDFPYELMFELKDGRGENGNGLSFYECSSPEDAALIKVAAALFFGGDQKNPPQKMTFRFVSTADLDAAGISYNKTPGQLHDASLNELHYDLVAVDGPKAIALLKLLFASDPKEIGQPPIIKSLTYNLRTGVFDKKHVKQGCLFTIHQKDGIGFDENSLTV